MAPERRDPHRAEQGRVTCIWPTATVVSFTWLASPLWLDRAIH
jgi:hypothetical protein